MTPPPRRLRLGIDLDGVVADFNSGWIERYNAEFATSISVADVLIWNAPVALTHFATMSEFWSWAATAGDGRSIFRVLDPFPGAVEALGRLARVHSIVIMTTKPSFAVHDTYEWIAEHRLPTTEVHIVDDKAVVDCDVYLDDADHAIEGLRIARPASMVCRYVRPWNIAHAGATDVTAWEEFERLVNTRASS